VLKSDCCKKAENQLGKAILEKIFCFKNKKCAADMIAVCIINGIIVLIIEICG
jgi:hypothetical protein